jgi:hypothetical protein
VIAVSPSRKTRLVVMFIKEWWICRPPLSARK